VDIDKEKLKKAFDMSHFDLNAILRGAQLTLVGGKLFHAHAPAWPILFLGADTGQQLTGPFRILPCSALSTIVRPQSPWLLV
jgi:hypothetical protein